MTESDAAPELPAEVPAVHALGEADLESAQRLVAAAGWNQVLADWRMFLARGRVFGCRDAAGQVIATAATMPYRGVGWISLMLVEERWRRRGLATRLMTACAEALESAGLAAALDATPMGREVYLRLGFRDALPLARWRADAPRLDRAPGDEARPFQPADLAAAVELDLPCFGGGRGWLFDRLARRSDAFACAMPAAGAVRGVLLGREGRVAAHLGPLLAPDLAAAQSLVRHALARIDAPVILDVPEVQEEFTAWLAELGFARQRPIVRMVRGEPRAPLGGETLFAVAGPDLG